MSTFTEPPPAFDAPIIDPTLGDDVIAHLANQIASAQRLLQIVLEQGAAIRARNVQLVVHHAGAMQVEMQRRVAIEHARSGLLERAGARLGVTASSVTLELMSQLFDSARAALTRERCALLRGLLEELKREHTVNRVLMQQELAFLDHLLRLVDGDGTGGYDAAGERPTTAGAGAASTHRHVFNLEV